MGFPSIQTFCKSWRTALLVILGAGVLWCAAAQGLWSAPLPVQTAAATAGPASQESQAKSASSDTPAKGNAESQEQKISPKEGEELLKSVDDILKFASKDTDLPIKSDVRRRLVDRDTVTAFVQKHLAEDDDAQRLRRSELVLKKFGLLPRDFDLEAFLVLLLREQVAGYYDPQTKTVNLLDWIDPEQQKPVLAHELTHALQDQSFGLERYLKAGDPGASKNEPTAADIETDEASAAHQAVVEGQAMIVLIDYTLAPTGQSVVDSPQIVAALKAGMLVGTADSVEFRSAPLYLREALIFPYRYGLDFEAELLTKKGRDEAYAGVFRKPPRTTREIMQPETYLAGEQISPMPLPDFEHDFKAYDKFDVGAIGEFDVATMIDQYAGAEASKDLYPHWRGGYYYAARPKGDPSAPIALLYVSRWSNPERSAEFAAIYAHSLEKRYLHVRDTGDGAVKNQPANLVFDTLTGNHSWLTEQGPVFIDVQGDMVVIAESLDQATTEQVDHELLATPAAAATGK